MPDIVIRHIDDAMADRIKAVARERKWTINEVVLHVLRHGLGLEHGDPVWLQSNDIAHLAGTWGNEEAKAFNDAMKAFEDTPNGTFGDPSKSKG